MGSHIQDVNIMCIYLAEDENEQIKILTSIKWVELLRLMYMYKQKKSREHKLNT